MSDLLPSRRPGVSRGRLAAAVVLWCVGVSVCGVVIAATLVSVAQAYGIAAPPGGDRLERVINNLRNVIVALLVALATLFATIGGVRYLLGGGDPGEAEAGKRTLRNAAIGYGIAALAPVLVEILQYIVGS
ncbi:pilin [Actinomadura chokoriensis]|uniref:Pilin n=1 Tax=Actinomadura chokoriensis TaxID=454156 RepID=A0ABV4R5W0_9ACTN